MKTLAIVEAQMASPRMPGKTMMPVLAKPMLWHVVRRIRAAQGVDEVVVATSDQPSDEPIRQFCWQNSISVFAGNAAGPLDRFYGAASKYWGDPLIRISGSCPFVDPELIERLLELYRSGEYDYTCIASGTGTAFLSGGEFPEGLGAECFSLSTLKQAWEEATEKNDREDVTAYIRRAPDRFRARMLKSQKNYSNLRWSVDNEADFELVSRVYKALYSHRRHFGFSDILSYLADSPDLASSSPQFLGGSDSQRLVA